VYDIDVDICKESGREVGNDAYKSARSQGGCTSGAGVSEGSRGGDKEEEDEDKTSRPLGRRDHNAAPVHSLNSWWCLPATHSRHANATRVQGMNDTTGDGAARRRQKS
jgi:hypothetical protein